MYCSAHDLLLLTEHFCCQTCGFSHPAILQFSTDTSSGCPTVEFSSDTKLPWGAGEGRHNMSVQNCALWRLGRFSEFLCWEPRTEARYHSKRCSYHSGNYMGLRSFVPGTRTKTKYLFLHLLQYHSSTVSDREDLGNVRWGSSILTSYSNVKVL